MTENGTRAIVVADKNTQIIDGEYEGLRMIVSPTEALRRVQELQAFVKEVMVDGIDFGRIPGTGDKPVLLQPGAQKLCEIYGLAWIFEDAGSTEDWNHGLFVYRKRCVLTARRDGRAIGNGVGSCNSKEDRYAYRWMPEKNIPNGIDKTTLKCKHGKFGLMFRLPNDDIFSLVNTIEKMACQRALVHAVLGATRSSGIFTQDVEDLPREVFGEADQARSWTKSNETSPILTTHFDEVALVAELTLAILEANDEQILHKTGKIIADDKNISSEARKGLRTAYAKRKAHLVKHKNDKHDHGSETLEHEREPGSDG